MQNQLLLISLFFVMLLHHLSAKAQGWGDCFGGISNGSTYALCPDEANNLLYVGGDFNNVGSLAYSSRGFASVDGLSWTDLSGTYDGDFTKCIAEYNGEIYHGLTSGSLFVGNQSDSTRKGNFDGSILSLAVYNGELYCAGNFTHQLDSPYQAFNFIAKWDGSNWTKLASGVKGGIASSGVYAMQVYNGELYVGGIFDTAGNTPCNNIAKWDGSHWIAVGDGVTGTENDSVKVSAFATYNGELIVGRFFSSAGTLPAANIAKWTGFTWSPMISAFDNEVAALAVYNNKLFAGGYFEFASSDNRIASWDGTNWSSLGNGITIGKRVLSLTVWKDALIVGGKFDQVDSIPVSNLAIWAEYSVGVSSPATNDAIFVWPNPVSTQLFIRNPGDNPIRRIELIDAYGKRFSETELSQAPLASVIQLNTTGCTAGLVIVRITTSAGVVNKKVVID